MQSVLIVEDCATERQLYTSWLSRNGLQVESVDSAEAALAHLRDHRPDLLLMDVVMPEMSGFDVCRRLKMDPRTRDIPIVFCTSKGLKYDQVWGMRQGAAAYLVKPVTTEKLVNTVAEVLRGGGSGAG